jgi:hypothetical protein
MVTSRFFKVQSRRSGIHTVNRLRIIVYPFVGAMAAQLVAVIIPPAISYFRMPTRIIIRASAYFTHSVHVSSLLKSLYLGIKIQNMFMEVIAVALGAKVEHLPITSRVHRTKLTGEISFRNSLCFDHQPAHTNRAALAESHGLLLPFFVFHVIFP